MSWEGDRWSGLQVERQLYFVIQHRQLFMIYLLYLHWLNEKLSIRKIKDNNDFCRWFKLDVSSLFSPLGSDYNGTWKGKPGLYSPLFVTYIMFEMFLDVSGQMGAWPCRLISCVIHNSNLNVTNGWVTLPFDFLILILCYSQF